MAKISLAAAKKTDEVKLNMSPLIDMIFILLIFFLVTTTFVKESGVDVNRPVPSDKPQTREEQNIVVNVVKDGMIYIDGQAIDIRSVQSRMERFIYENPEGNVIITADKE
ncbi:MAG: biopolymer transporter ExbD, partial [Deltaproteobacteria bacterium]|nr:biopolymer transporter ExbD [Deltaproteobacteria bacterium]